jgi:transcription initiation factor TFIID subunit 5
LRRLSWPVFVYSYLDLIIADAVEDGEKFFREFGPQFEQVHSDELRAFEMIKLRSHVMENSVAKLYRENKYRLPLNKHVYYNLLTFLESNAESGGAVIIYILQSYCEVRETERGPLDQYSFDAIVNRARGLQVDDADLQEGIPGAFTGVTNQDIMDHTTMLKLGMPAMEPELAGDVRAELEDEDAKNPPDDGQPSLVEEFDRIVKREDSADAPPRGEIPYPPSRARDVLMEVQKIKENRDRFKMDKIESKQPGTTGMAPGVSICMFTFHNTLDS